MNNHLLIDLRAKFEAKALAVDSGGSRDFAFFLPIENTKHIKSVKRHLGDSDGQGTNAKLYTSMTHYTRADSSPRTLDGTLSA